MIVESVGVAKGVAVPYLLFPSGPDRFFLLMFDGRAFRTWTHVLAGACGFSVLFLGIMVMAEEVIGDGARVTQTGLTISAAAFLGYLGTAWIVRLDEARPR